MSFNHKTIEQKWQDNWEHIKRIKVILILIFSGSEGLVLFPVILPLLFNRLMVE